MIHFLSNRCKSKTISLFCMFSIFTFLFLIIIFDDQIVLSQKVNNNLTNTTTTTTTLAPYVKIKDLVIHVDLAITPDEQSKGLSIKNTLNDSDGMLFPFDTPGDYSFWMKDMKFPIDIIWIDSNYKIVVLKKTFNLVFFFFYVPLILHMQIQNMY